MNDKIHIPDMEYLEKIWKEIEGLKSQFEYFKKQYDKEIESIWNHVLDYDP